MKGSDLVKATEQLETTEKNWYRNFIHLYIESISFVWKGRLIQKTEFIEEDI